MLHNGWDSLQLRPNSTPDDFWTCPKSVRASPEAETPHLFERNKGLLGGQQHLPLSLLDSNTPTPPVPHPNAENQISLSSREIPIHERAPGSSERNRVRVGDFSQVHSIRMNGPPERESDPKRSPVASNPLWRSAMRFKAGNASLDQPSKSGDGRQEKTWINHFRKAVIG